MSGNNSNGGSALFFPRNPRKASAAIVSNNEMRRKPRIILVLCNRYGLPIAARSLGEFHEVSEASVSAAILTERDFSQKFAQRTAARRVELKMARRPPCLSVAGYASPARTQGDASS